ncbi:unnamed protein product [Closterium sp. NIES-54]
MPVAKKRDVLQEFRKWLVQVERQAKKSVLMLRSDRGGEFLGKEFTDFVDGKGIVNDLTCPYTPQQNGMAEREIRMAVESVRTMLLHMNVPHHLRHLSLRQAVWRGGKLAPKARWGLHMGVLPESKGWEVLDLTDNKLVTSVEVIFYETLSLEVWKAKFGPASGWTQAHPPTDTSMATAPLLVEVDEPSDEDVVEVLPPPPALAPPFPVADRPASTPVSATRDEGSLEAPPVAPASSIADGRQGIKLVDQDGKPSTTLVDDLTVNEEGELSARDESTDSDLVEVPITKPELRRTSRARRPPERLSFHTCLPPAAFPAVYDGVEDDQLYDNAKEDEELPELDPDMHADPEHRWDIATMTVREVLASWKGEAVKAAMEEEIRSLVDMGTWELVERPHGVNIMKNWWVLTTKYRLDDTVEREKARLVVKGFTQVCGADYDETYSPVSSYVTLRIFLSIVVGLDLNLMQLDMKNALLQSKLDRVLYMYQPDYFDDGTGWECKLLKSLYGLKQSPLLWYRALDGVLLGTGWKKSQVDEALYFKADDVRVTCWVLVYVQDLLAASSSPAMLNELKELLEAAFELREISPVVKYLALEIVRDKPAKKLWLHQQGYADKLCRRFIDEEQGGRVPKTPCMTLSSTESEYVAATNAGKEGHRLRFLLAEFKLLDAGKPTILRVDNKSAITVAAGLGLTGNLKHMERRYAWLQHMVRRGKFELKYIPTTEQPADFLTKALHFPDFKRCSIAIGQVRLADVGDGDDNVQQ